MYPLLRKNKLLFIVLALLIVVSVVFALPTDIDKPMNIVADSSIINYKTGINTYIGHVKIDQGSSHLLADRLITKNNKQHKMAEAVAYGEKTLADYTTIPKKGDKVLHAQARVIKFFPPTSTVVLTGDVVVTQGENNFHGPVIIYNMKDQIVTVPPNPNGQATIILEPKQLG